MNPQTGTRNANSVPAAGAAGQSTASSNPSSGVLPVSALADALVNYGGQQSGNQTQVQPPPQDGGDANLDPNAAPTGDAGGGAPGQGAELVEPQEGLTETGQPVEGEPGAEPEPGQEPGSGDGSEDLPQGVQRRFGQLQAEIRELRTELENARSSTAQSAPADTRPSGLENVTDAADLAVRQDRSEAGLEEVEVLLSKLAIAPTRVEQYLRHAGVMLRDDEGNEDFSAERMADVLSNAKQGFRQTLRAIPKRKEYLANYQAAHSQVLKVYPWVGDRTDQRHAMMQTILGQFPGLKAAPNFEYWVACAIEGHQTVQSRTGAARRPNAPSTNGASRNGTNGQRRPGPNTGSGGAAVRLNPNKAKVDQARQNVLKEGTKRALSAFFETSGFVKS